MHKVADWTSLHSLKSTEVQDVLQAFSANALISSPTHWPLPEQRLDAEIGQMAFLNNKMVPAFSAALGRTVDLENISVLNLRESREERPHAVFSEKDKHTSVYLNWSGTPDDAISLAHEFGHAAHYIFSGTDKIPPMVRETCAFLSELVVLDFLLENDCDLFAPPRRAWDAETDTYLGLYVDDLQSALGNSDAAYVYSWNYPLARLAAVEILRSYKYGKASLIDLFESGADGMSLLPIATMAAQADKIHNYLPPFRAAADPATSAYQSLARWHFWTLTHLRDRQNAELRRSMRNFSAICSNRQPLSDFAKTHDQSVTQHGKRDQSINSLQSHINLRRLVIILLSCKHCVNGLRKTDQSWQYHQEVQGRNSQYGKHRLLFF